MLRSLLNPVYDSVTVEDALNSDIDDGVNYLDPLWLAETKALYWLYLHGGLDGFQITTSGSGSVAVNGGAGRVQLETGTTSGSEAIATKSINENTTSKPLDWDRDRYLSTGVYLRNLPDGDYTAWVATGDPQGGNSGFGFRIEVDAVYGVVHDGSSLSDTLITTVNDSDVDLEARFNAADSVEFTVNGTEATISNGLPSGTPFQQGLRTFYKSYITNSVAADRRIEFSDVRVVQKP